MWCWEAPLGGAGQSETNSRLRSLGPCVAGLRGRALSVKLMQVPGFERANSDAGVPQSWGSRVRAVQGGPVDSKRSGCAEEVAPARQRCSAPAKGEGSRASLCPRKNQVCVCVLPGFFF